MAQRNAGPLVGEPSTPTTTGGCLRAELMSASWRVVRAGGPVGCGDLHVRVGVVMREGSDDGDRAVCAVQDVAADGSEEQATEATASPAADHHELGASGGVDEDVGRAALEHLGPHVDVRVLLGPAGDRRRRDAVLLDLEVVPGFGEGTHGDTAG